MPVHLHPGQHRGSRVDTGRNLLVEDFLAVSGRRDSLPLLAKDGQALGLREITDRSDCGADEEDGAKHDEGHDDEGHPNERSDEREETPDLQSRWG